MPQTNKLSKDTILKVFFLPKDRLADLLNTGFFNGEQIIHSKDIQILDSDCSNVGETVKGIFMNTKRQRDKLIHVRLNKGNEVIIGIEFQSRVDYTMAFRFLEYTHDTYSRERKEKRNPKVINLVVYGGEKKWTAPTSLKKMGKPLPVAMMEEMVYDGSYEVCDLKRIDTEKLRVKEVREAIEGLQMMYDQIDVLSKSKKKISKDAALVIATLTGRKEALDNISETEGDEIIMCEAFEEWAKKIEKKSKIKGEKNGIRKGIKKGRLQGKAEGERLLMTTLLKQKVGKLSEEIIKELSHCSNSKLNQLTQQFNHLDSEIEIRKILFS